VVSRSSLLHGASPGECESLALQSWVLAPRRGELFARRHSRLPGVLVVVYGMIKLSVRARSGNDHVLRLVEPGQTFGEETTLLGHPCRYEARAVVDSKLVVIPSRAVDSLVDRDSRFARQIGKVLAQRCNEYLEKLESSCTRSSEQRLAHYLNTLVEREGSDNACGIRLPVPKAVIASLLDMTKETLSRGLLALSNQGLIRVSHHNVAILDRARLSRLISGPER
jgi:CRP-like cAMP-binding protein